jgi:glycosyltransferase involved in cell wall biosynthesis
MARALSAEGYAVEIAAIAADGLPDREPVAPARPGAAGTPEPAPGTSGPIELRRYRPRGPWAIAGAGQWASGPGAGRSATGGRSRSSIRRLGRPFLDARRWLAWPHTVRGWWAALRRDLAPADLYHACGALTIAAALDARRAHPVGPAGGPARVVYDAIDLASDSNTVTAMPRRIRARIAATEARWAAAADAIVTINEGLARRLADQHPGRTITVLPNFPEPPGPLVSHSGPGLLRAAAGLPPTTRVVLFSGRLGPDLGLEAAAEAILEVPDAALVLLGFGRGLAASRSRDADPRYAGRHVTLDARSPDEVVAWTASADVCLMPHTPVSENQRLGTPNKFWEAVVAGTPSVVVRGMTLLEQLVTEGDLGAVAASGRPADLAAAIRTVLDRLDAEGPAWRRRIAAAVPAGGWPAAATEYRRLVRSLAGPAAPAGDGR